MSLTSAFTLAAAPWVQSLSSSEAKESHPGKIKPLTIQQSKVYNPSSNIREQEGSKMPKSDSKHYDVVVVGAGNAALTAAQ